MRSRNDWPGSAAIRTRIRSDSTLVPPVTAERSPPDSRITGADSPVMADSSTEATPSMTSPSPGINWPASTTTTSPLRSAEAETISSLPSTSLRASVSLRILRSVSACALPRPSATASAKFANTTVNHSQTLTLMVNHSGSAVFGCRIASRRKTSVVRMLPISTTNITGFFQTCAGESFLKLSFTAAFRMSGWNREISLVRAMSVDLSGAGGEMLHDGAERVSREERQRSDDDDHGDEQPGEHPAVGGEGAEAWRGRLLADHRAGNRKRRHDHR